MFKYRLKYQIKRKLQRERKSYPSVVMGSLMKVIFTVGILNVEWYFSLFITDFYRKTDHTNVFI